MSKKSSRPPNLTAIADDRQIAVTDAQIAELCAMTAGSVAYYRNLGKLTPIVPSGNVYNVGALKKFCAERVSTAAMRVTAALAAANPHASPHELVEMGVAKLRELSRAEVTK